MVLVKIRMTDSLCVAKFSYIKPEVEMEFDQEDYNRDTDGCLAQVGRALTEAIRYQLGQICDRASVQDKVMIKNSLDVDPRLKEMLSVKQEVGM